MNFAVAPLDLDARPRVRLIGLRLLGRRAGGEEHEGIGGDRRAEGERHLVRVRVWGRVRVRVRVGVRVRAANPNPNPNPNQAKGTAIAFA